MDNAAALSLIVGAVAPIFVGLMVKASFAPWLKALICLVVAAAIGFGTIWQAGSIELSWGNALVIIAAVFGASQVTYRYLVARIPGVKEFLEGLLIHD